MNLELVGPTRHVGIARRVYPETAENAAEPEPAPETPGEGSEPVAETAEISANVPTTQPLPSSASVPSETAHAR
jgi:hypothetical protein